MNVSVSSCVPCCWCTWDVLDSVVESTFISFREGNKTINDSLLWSVFSSFWLLQTSIVELIHWTFMYEPCQLQVSGRKEISISTANQNVRDSVITSHAAQNWKLSLILTWLPGSAKTSVRQCLLRRLDLRLDTKQFFQIQRDVSISCAWSRVEYSFNRVANGQFQHQSLTMPRGIYVLVFNLPLFAAHQSLWIPSNSTSSIGKSIHATGDCHSGFSLEFVRHYSIAAERQRYQVVLLGEVNDKFVVDDNIRKDGHLHEKRDNVSVDELEAIAQSVPTPGEEHEFDDWASR